MKRFRLLFVGCLLVGLGSPAVRAEQSGASAKEPAADSMFERDPLEAVPASFVLDKARLFNEQEAAQLSARLKEFSSRHDLLIYVVAYSILFGESLDERATRLQKSWLEGKRGIVMVYQRGTERLTFSSTAAPLSYVARPVLEEMFASAYAQASQYERGAERVIAAAKQLMDDLPAAIQSQQSSDLATAEETRNFVGWALAGLLLVSVTGMVVFYLLRRRTVKVSTTFTFPPIRIPERFGAGYSGGHHAEMRFTAPAE
jgi:uncharacterized membrane protein YgcG